LSGSDPHPINAPPKPKPLATRTTHLLKLITSKG
jgi:hypothetical protein